MKARLLRLTLAAGTVAALAAPVAPAHAMTCIGPDAFETACAVVFGVHAQVCAQVPHTGGKVDVHDVVCPPLG
ncbi:MAG TPA: hypothetical protein VFQ85_10535 [Mycobacteriales bacterium]|jgi:hypothetical protein|nr:hypothetical protein [Mycobacteriales bacterium]